MAVGQKAKNQIRDRAPPPKERLPDTPQIVQYRRVVERRRNRGRDGGPGPCVSGGTGEGRAGTQDGSGSIGGTEDHHDRADGAANHHGGAEDHQSQTADHHGGADRAEDLHGGADRAGAYQCGADRADALHGGAETPGRDWDLGKTETQETERARTEAGNIGSPSIFSLVATKRADSP